MIVAGPRTGAEPQADPAAAEVPAEGGSESSGSELAVAHDVQSDSTAGVYAAGIVPARATEALVAEVSQGALENEPQKAADAAGVGAVTEGQADVTQAEAAYRRDDERGDGRPPATLGVLLERNGDLAGAEAAYRRADERGDANGAFNLGDLLAERGDLAAAEAAFRRADERGDAGAAVNLACCSNIAEISKVHTRPIAAATSGVMPAPRPTSVCCSSATATSPAQRRLTAAPIEWR